MGYMENRMKSTSSNRHPRRVAGRLIGFALAGWAVAALAVTAVTVPTVLMQARAVDTGLELEGVVQPVKQSTVAAQAGGRVATLAVRMGDRVRAGQLLATIDDREAAVGVQRSQAQVNQAQAELRNARAHYERTRDLQAQGFVSQAALDTAQTQYQAAQAGREQATAGAQQSALAQGYTRVTAPYDGWVLQTHVMPGDLALPGKPVVTLYAPQPLRAVVQLPASRAELARQAAQVQVLLGEKWVNPVERSSMPSADPVSQTVEWRLELAAADTPSLLPGQPVRVRIIGTPAQRLVVPASAVLRRGELTAVYVVSGKGFALRAVRLGADHGAQGIEIAAGLSAGERVAQDAVRAGLVGAVPAP